MHGLGNDFVVLDARARPRSTSRRERRRAIADRRRGVGCDQLIVLEPPTERGADVFMRIYNPDGGEAGACGNATRCVASVLMDERGTDQVTVQTIAGLLDSQKAGVGTNGLPIVSVDMGPGAARLARHPGARAVRHQPHAGRARARCRIRSAPTWEIRTRRSSSTMPRRSRWPSSVPSSSTTASSPSAPTSASRSSAARAGCGCGSGSAAPGLTLGLRVGGLRGGRRGDPPRLGAAQGRRDARWRHARDRVVARWPCADDRWRRARLQGRARPLAAFVRWSGERDA